MKTKKILSLIAILLIILSCFSCGKNNSTANSKNCSWKLVSSVEACFSKNMGGFFDEKFGIMVGGSGAINYTKDGGKTWSKANNSSMCLFGLNIINKNVAYSCGNGSYVIKTTDGGANWSHAENFGQMEPNHPRYISFANENEGWLAAANKFDRKGSKVILASTKDGGATWDNITLPKEVEEIITIYLRTPKNGYIIDNKSNLYITNDGGKNFAKQTLGLKDAYLPGAKFQQHTVLNFTDENHGLIAYENEHRKVLIARTSDGGKTWINETIPDITSGGLYLSQDGKILTITDGSGLYINILEYK